MTSSSSSSPISTRTTGAPIGDTDTSVAAARRLRAIVRGNAAYCAITGTVLAAGAGALDSRVGLHAAVLVVVGVGLVGYAAMLWWATGQDHLLVATGQTAVAGDLGWIVMAVVVIAFTNLLNSNGQWTLAVLSVLVAIFFVVQAVTLRQLERGA